MEPQRGKDVPRQMRKLNPTILALLAGLVVLVALIAYFASIRNPDQDKLKDVQLNTAENASSAENALSAEKRCASQAIYDLIKRELFNRASQMRGSDQDAYDKLANYAVVRMENPVTESEDGSTGAINCSGSLSLDLPPGVAVAGGRRTLMTDVDYTVLPAADGTGSVVQLRNVDAIVVPLATLGRVGPPPQSPVAAEGNEVAPEQPEANAAASQSTNVQPGPPSNYPGRPSFDCNKARGPTEIAICSDAGLSALDLNLATQYRRAFSTASPDQQALLQQTAKRFYAYRDRCPDNRCIGDAYVGRMREIRDIVEGRWQAPR